MRVRHQKKVVVGVVLLTIFLFWVSSQPSTQAAKKSYSPSLDDKSSFLVNAFKSPEFMIIGWPLVLAALEAALNILTSENLDKAEGEYKFRVWYQDTTYQDTAEEEGSQEKEGVDEKICTKLFRLFASKSPSNKIREFQTSIVNIDWLKSYIWRYTIKDIERLPSDSYSDLFNLGIDLCIGAMAADLAAIPTINSIGTTDFAIVLMDRLVMLLIMHFIAAIWVTLVLRWSYTYKKIYRFGILIVGDITGLFALASSYALFVSISSPK